MSSIVLEGLKLRTHKKVGVTSGKKKQTGSFFCLVYIVLPANLDVSQRKQKLNMSSTEIIYSSQKI